MKDFLTFIRTQGVVGLAVGLVLGGAVASVVKAIVDDIVNPLLGLIVGQASGLKDAVLVVGGAEIMYGDFLNTLLNFVVIAAVIYCLVMKTGLDKMDAPKA